MVELERRPKREVERSAADGLQRVGKRAEAVSAEPLRPDDDRRARNKPGKNSSERADPMIVNRPLEKQSGRNEQGHNTDTTEELRADAVFERPFGLRKRLGKVRWQEVFCAASCSGTGRRRGLWGTSRRVECATQPVAAPAIRPVRTGRRGPRRLELPGLAASAAPPEPWQLLYRYPAQEWY